MVEPVWACPVCGEPLVSADRSVACSNSHVYDVAREGYVNLLLAQHRHSKDPGYSREMIAGRRDFFDVGHYEALADDLARLIAGHLPGRPGQTVLDAGCGEGYYLRRLDKLLEPASSTLRCGLDISKHGIRVAAKRDPAGAYAVAGTHRMPVLPGSVDVLVTHFSPVSPADFRRVLRPDGVVLVGGPGERHLFGFKELLYENPTTHEEADLLGAEDGFELVATHHLRHPLSLRGPGQVANLLLMTPFFWSADAATRERLATVSSLDTEIEVVVRAYRRVSRTPE